MSPIIQLKNEIVLANGKLTYEKLLQERDHLITANHIHKLLINEVVKGADLKHLVEEFYKLTKIPTIVLTTLGQSITCAGLSSLSGRLTEGEIANYVHKDNPKNMLSQMQQFVKDHDRSYFWLTSPIHLHEQLIGYCLFVFKNKNNDQDDYWKLLIEKIASICSLSLFYESTKLDYNEQIKSLFLKEILNGNFVSNEEIIEKGYLFQADLNHPFHICTIEYSHKEIDSNASRFQKELFKTISQYCSKQKQSYLMNQNGKRINILVTDLFEKNNGITDYVEGLFQEISSKYKKWVFHIGVSKKTQYLLDANQAYKNALSSLRVVTNLKQIVYFDSLGVIGALINENNEHEVREMANSFLGNIGITCQKDVDLIQTLYSFLVNGGNLEKTADDLSLSISGLRYRINKLEEILQKDLRSPLICYQLLLSIQALIILGDLELKNN